MRRADIEESKSRVAMNAHLPQASYPSGNFSDTSCVKLSRAKGSLGRAFTACTGADGPSQGSFSPNGLQQVSVLLELPFGHSRYRFESMPPQPNSLPERVFGGG